MAKTPQQPLWQLLIDKGFTSERARSEALVLAGAVRINGEIARAPADRYPIDAHLEVTSEGGAVGRGGEKLTGALTEWKIDLASRVCADVGSSTGGFTEVMLKAGATKVYAIDVGYGELAWKLRRDPRVVVMERTNARYVENLPEQVSFVAIDVSFISLKLILPAVKGWLASSAEIVCLIKPQFEAPRELIPEGGIVVDPRVHERVVREFVEDSLPPGLFCWGIASSPITGRGGNREFLAWLKQEPSPFFELEKQLEKLF